ncbi:MAG: DUF4215 domain-containing protein [Myxococcales bacterium]|nr:DUF4215 domain-containing protein [Myxococcales bacterium]
MTNFSLRGSLGLGLSALLVIGCNGDDGTTGASGTDSSTGGTDSTTNTTNTSNTTPGTASATSTTSMSGTDSAGETTGSTGGTDSSPTSGTDSTGGGVCGDGVLDAGEECDDGAANGTDRSVCDTDCTVKGAVCGNGVEESGEECDDGNLDPGDGCDENCMTEAMDPVCGNGVLEEGEACDDGNLDDDDGCQSDCTETPPGECGNGVQEWDELCDDGNLVNNDGCESDCTPTPLPACLPPEDYISCDGSLDKNDPLAPFQALGLACSDKNSESILISDTQFERQDLVLVQDQHADRRQGLRDRLRLLLVGVADLLRHDLQRPPGDLAGPRGLHRQHLDDRRSADDDHRPPPPLVEQDGRLEDLPELRLRRPGLLVQRAPAPGHRLRGPRRHHLDPDQPALRRDGRRQQAARGLRLPGRHGGLDPGDRRPRRPLPLGLRRVHPGRRSEVHRRGPGPELLRRRPADVIGGRCPAAPTSPVRAPAGGARLVRSEASRPHRAIRARATAISLQAAALRSRPADGSVSAIVRALHAM